jgi:hypothetical protein
VRRFVAHLEDLVDVLVRHLVVERPWPEVVAGRGARPR